MLFDAHDAVFVLVMTCTSKTTTKGYSGPEAVTMMLGSYAMQCLCMVRNSTHPMFVYVTRHGLAFTVGQCSASAHRHSSQAQ
jgi:hypothetical protein